MENNNVKDFIKIKDNFQYAINLKYDVNSVDKIENYILTPGALDIIEETIMSLSSNTNDRAKILIGPYGKGKSHLLLVLMSLLSDLNLKSSKKIIKVIQGYNKELATRIKELAEDKFKLLPIVVTSSSLDMKQILLNSLMETLIRNDLGHIMPDSYFESAKKTISLWQSDYPKTYTQFTELLEVDINEYIALLDDFNQKAFLTFKQMYPKVTAGAEFNPLFGTEIDTIFLDVVKELNKIGISGIYLVYDEFSKFLEGSIDKNSALDIKLLQDLAELCNRSSVKSQIHLTLISHKDISSYTDSLPKEKIDSWKAVSERFKRIEISNSKVQTYHLISKVITKDENKWSLAKNNMSKKLQSLDSSLKKTGIVRGLGFSSEDFIDEMYPLHPMTAIILPEIAEFVAQNERTLFTFLASKEKKAIWHVINELKENGIITPDYVFDYFEDQFKKENFDSVIYKTWRSSKEICNIISSNDDICGEIAIKVIKTLSLIQMIGAEEFIPPTSSMIDLCLEWDYSYEQISSAFEYLLNNNYIRYISSKKHYVLRSTRSINIKGILKDTMTKRQKLYDLNEIMTSVLGKRVIYPNKYNAVSEIIRYYKLDFTTSSQILEIQNFDEYIRSQDNDGILIAVLLDSDDHYEEVVSRVSELQNNLVFTVVNNEFTNYEEHVQSYDALKYLIEENELTNFDEVLADEYQMELDEISGKLMSILKIYFEPSLNGASFIHKGDCIKLSKKSQFNNVLSQCMQDQYNKMPVIVNEMINRDTINSAILKARDKIVYALLKNEIKADLGFVGHGPEVTIMRATLLTTGVYDGNKKLNYSKLPTENLENVFNEIESFLKKSSEEGPISFTKLYEKLSKAEFNIGLKKGLIPIYLAAVIHKYKRYIVITQNRHEVELTINVMNDINRHPHKYSVYLEAWDEEKEKYLLDLENVFSDFIEEEEKEFNSFNYIAKGMHRWFLYLPRYAKEYQLKYEYDGTKSDVNKASVYFRNKIKPSMINARELLFVVIPKIFECKSYNDELVRKIKDTRLEIDGFITEIKEELCNFLVDEFGNHSEQSLSTSMHFWYNKLNPDTRVHKFDDSSEVLIKSIEYTSNNHEEFLEIFTKEVIGLSILDWNDEKLPYFMAEVKKHKAIVELHDKKISSGEKKELEQSNYEVTFFDNKNEKYNISFGNNGFSTDQAHSFYDELSGVLDDHMYGLDKNEARQVIMEILKKVL